MTTPEQPDQVPTPPPTPGSTTPDATSGAGQQASNTPSSQAPSPAGSHSSASQTPAPAFNPPASSHAQPGLLRQTASMLQRITWPRFVFLFVVLLIGISIFGGVSGIGAGLLARVFVACSLVAAGAKLFLPVWEPMIDGGTSTPAAVNADGSTQGIIKRAGRGFADRLAEMSWWRFTFFSVIFLAACALFGSLIEGAIGERYTRKADPQPVKLEITRDGDQISIAAVRADELSDEEVAARKEHDKARKEHDKARKQHDKAAKEHEKARKEAERAVEQAKQVREQAEQAASAATAAAAATSSSTSTTTSASQVTTEVTKQRAGVTERIVTVQKDGKTTTEKIYENDNAKVIISNGMIKIEGKDGKENNAQISLSNKGITINAKDKTDGDAVINIGLSGINVRTTKDGETKTVTVGPNGKKTETTEKTESSESSTVDGKSGAVNATTKAEVDAAISIAVPEAGNAIELPMISTEAQAKVWEDAFRDAVPQIESQLEEAIEDNVSARLERRNSSAISDAITGLAMVLIMIMVSIKIVAGGRLAAEKQAARAQQDAQAEILKRQLSEAQLQTMQAQVEPHFLFNTLASVDYLIETDPPRASQMQKNLIQYLRSAMPKMRETGNSTLGREVGLIRAFLEILKMRMDDRLTVRYDIPYECEIAQFPPMMLQSLVENAIKHGLEPKPEGGSLTVSASIRNGLLQVRVADTGIGFAPTLPTSGTQVGLANIRERLRLMFGAQAQLIVQANEPAGTVMTIEIPYTPLSGQA